MEYKKNQENIWKPSAECLAHNSSSSHLEWHRWLSYPAPVNLVTPKTAESCLPLPMASSGQCLTHILPLL